MARITATATQGGADAFVQAEMQTALQGQTRQAYSVEEITYEFILPATGGFPLAVAANQRLELVLSRRTKAAMPTLADVDVMRKFAWGGLGGGAGSGYPFPTSGSWKPETPILIVEDPLYVILDSAGTAVIWSAVVEIQYEIVTISEVDRLTLLTQSLV